MQSALVSACEKWSRVSRRDDPDAYVRRMVVNAHISAWRRSGRRESPVAEVRDSTAPGLAQPVVESGRRLADVHGAAAAEQRAAVVLRYYEDLEYGEIAAILGVAEPTARSHVHRALAALRRELGRELTADGTGESGGGQGGRWSRWCRAGLESRSAHADATAPVADRARAEVGRRRRTRLGLVAAAAAVVLVVGGVAVVTEWGWG